jgi:sugar lactone lactonase YvrE
MTSLSHVVHYKANIETVFELPIKVSLSGPREDSKQNMFVCSKAGEIIKFTEKGEYSIILSLTGQPNCIAFDFSEEAENENSSKNIKSNEENKIDTYYFTDIANSVIYCKKPDSEKPEVVIRDYEGNPLLGPTSLVLNTEDNSLIFCDAGNFESTSLSYPKGGVYYVELESHTTRPIIEKCLAYPADVIFEPVIGTGYIAETFANRILRITENPQGIFHTSVFYVFNGRVGPTAITIDDQGNIYASRFEYQKNDKSVNGLISVINKDGELVGELELPKMSEITGMFIPKKLIDDSKEMENNSKTNVYLYFTEKNFNGVKRIKLNNFISDIEKS